MNTKHEILVDYGEGSYVCKLIVYKGTTANCSNIDVEPGATTMNDAGKTTANCSYIDVGSILIDLIELDYSEFVIEHDKFSEIIKSEEEYLQTKKLYTELFHVCFDEGIIEYPEMKEAKVEQRYLIYLYTVNPNCFKNINIKLYPLPILNLPNYPRDFSMLLPHITQNYSKEKKQRLITEILSSEKDYIEIYTLQSFQDYLYLDMLKLIQMQIIVKKCICCKNYFISKDSAEKYCDRIYKNNKTCKDVGYLLKVENNELLKLYNRAYKTKHSQKQRNIRNKSKTTIKKYNAALKTWRTIARSKLQECTELYENAKSESDKNIIVHELEEVLNKDLEV
ncbi:MAG: hypothetical protein GX154_06045 [Clostridiales bacterium]|nr:hypothetical protein [Clostridiales bacterium]